VQIQKVSYKAESEEVQSMVIHGKYLTETGSECVVWTELAQSTDQWQTLADMITYFCVP
jgi:hypothetical protein